MVISKTPLRISFVGGGSDLEDFYSKHGGKVISTTINKYIYVIIKERYDNKIVLHYTDNEIVSSVDEVRHELIREAMRMTNVGRKVEIITLADIPSQGSGLGSSSTLTVGLLNALYNYKGKQVTNEQLAEEACAIEIDILRKPIGKQDQYAVAFGGFNKITFNGSIDVKRIELSDNEKNRINNKLFLHYTNILRKSETILTEQKKNNNEKFIIKNTELVDKFEKILIDKKFDDIGIMLRKNWEYKKELAAKITNTEIDAMVNIAMEYATGCKISGAGGGGFLLSYVPDNHKEFLSVMGNYEELSFSFDNYGSRILLNTRN
jgi:D-glycero-alpha-D-manno-heptose-7-phosphate kinase